MNHLAVPPGTLADQRADSKSFSHPEAPTVQSRLNQVQLIREVMNAAMREGEHYARVPGCNNRLTLLKPGAEKICLTLRLAPAYNVEERTLERDHREYHVTATLSCVLTEGFIGNGVGHCSSLEAQCHFGGATEKAGQENPPDLFNSVLKLAKQHALVDAVLTSTAAGDIFSQGLKASPFGQSPRTPVSFVPKPALTPDPSEDAAEPKDFRFTEIHFGKNKGLILAELTPQQLHWYEKEWMPKKASQGSVSPKDLSLIRGLKAYRVWRNEEKALAAGGAGAVVTT